LNNQNIGLNRRMKVIESFAGIGAFHKAFTNLEIDAEFMISEIDKHAIASYNAIHGETLNLGDIRKIDFLPECDIFTYSWPCQDISVAGSQKGFDEGSETRSSLLWEIKRLLKVSPKPYIMVAENVKGVKSKKFRRPLNDWIRFLSSIGYTSSWKILNACDFGIPQNRERFFMVSCIDGRYFDFPKGGHPLTRSFEDMLEEDVDESYYMTQEQIKNYNSHKKRHDAAGHGFGWKPMREREREIANSLTANPTRHTQNFCWRLVTS